MTTEDGTSISQGNPTQGETAELIEANARNIIAIRHRPLLILYYPGQYGNMMEEDVSYCYQAFRSDGITPENPLPELDVLIHTYGGNPLAAYQLGQTIRDFVSNDVACLVPQHAYSAGTLLCFSGNRICLGHSAGLSPIDITHGDVELTSIDYFRDFAKDSQEHIQRVLREMEHNGVSTVGSDLLCCLVKDIGALKVGQYYRARTLTGHYAQKFLDQYMFAGQTNAAGKRNKVIKSLLFEAPAHEFHIDFHMCLDIGLVMQEMNTTESDATKGLIELLNDLVVRDIICPYIDDESRMPFIALFR
jgi:hypothetical protein